jgi:DNA-binding MarR family transcriptional regulator
MTARRRRDNGGSRWGRERDVFVAVDNEGAVARSLRMATTSTARRTRVAAPPAADEPARLLREVARLHVRAQRATLACAGASATQCTILTELGRAPSMTLAELSRRLRLDKGWTSRAVEQLAQDGLVDKAGSDTDRRVVALSLTRAGAARHRRIDETLDAQVERVIARVPDAERPAVARALALLHDAYRAELTGDDAITMTEAGCLTTP